jgi:hypothetical protein
VVCQFDVGLTVAAYSGAHSLFTIAQDLTKMQVAADVSGMDIGQIKVGGRSVGRGRLSGSGLPRIGVPDPIERDRQSERRDIR